MLESSWLQKGQPDILNSCIVIVSCQGLKGNSLVLKTLSWKAVINRHKSDALRPEIKYTHLMKNSLLETNHHLKNPVARTKALERNVMSSSAIEGIRVIRDAKSGRFISQEKRDLQVKKSVTNSR